MLEPDRINRRQELGLAAFTTVVALFLLIEGGWTALTIDAVRQLTVTPAVPLSAEDVALMKNYLPAMYLVAVEGFLFGSIAVAGVVGLLLGKAWVRQMLVVASVLLALTAIVAIGMVPPTQWDTQVVLISFCGLWWWQSKKWQPI